MSEMTERCEICHKPFTEDEWENRHMMHVDTCPNFRKQEILSPCDCDFPVHAKCCPECEQPKKSSFKSAPKKLRELAETDKSVKAFLKSHEKALGKIDELTGIIAELAKEREAK